MTDLQKAKEDRETFTATYDVVEKQSRLDLDKALTIKSYLLMGKDYGEESWKQTKYWSAEQEQALIDKMHKLLIEL